MIGLPFVYAVAGACFALFAALSLRARRPGNAAFWALLALSFLAGDRLGDRGNGVLAIALAAIAGLRLVRGPAADARPADPVSAPIARRGRLFALVLVVPAATVAGTLLFRRVPALVDPAQATLVALTLGVLLALAGGRVWLRAGAGEPFVAGLRLIDGVGWAAVLPQMLASLGAVFALAHVGDALGGIALAALPPGSLLAAVIAYALGMAVLTILMGNAFAAFPVMAAAIGVPLLIRGHGGDPAAVAAIGMLAGFCGTLLTPLAANFNLVPAALLALRDRYAVIRAQAPTALAVLVADIVILYLFGFPA